MVLPGRLREGAGSNEVPPAMSSGPAIATMHSRSGLGPHSYRMQRPVKPDYTEPVKLIVRGKQFFSFFILQDLANFTEYFFLSSPGPLNTGRPPNYQLRGDGRDLGIGRFQKLIPLPHPTEGFQAQSRWSRVRSRPGTLSQRPEGTSEGHSD